MPWNEPGTVYRGEIKDHDGEWLVGDNANYFDQHDHPINYPGLTGQLDVHRLMFKVWRASRSSDRYTGDGHPAVVPAHNRRHELVDVIEGLLHCTSREYIVSLGPDQRSRSVSHAFSEHRIWNLDGPTISNGARGITLCHAPNAPLSTGGIGRGYEYHLIGNRHPTLSEWNPVYPRDMYNFVLVIPFDGDVHIVYQGESIEIEDPAYAFFSLREKGYGSAIHSTARNCALLLF